ncbi:DNA repair protein RadC [Candidatus Woesebacteria bacterium]|nr:DNA repair protein RadC [Candidatus Woesebacteria bacterium]
MNKRYAWPRERLMDQGVANLKDDDLIALILRTGDADNNVLQLSSLILKKRSLVEWSRSSVSDWLEVKGVNQAKAAALVAAFELSARAEARRRLPRPTITSPSAAAQQFHNLRDKRKEYLSALYLNARHELVHQEIISIGIVDRSLIHPRELFAPALAHAASAVIIGHNHPSGSSEPSEEDLAVTRSLSQAAQLLQLTLLDHLIVTVSQHLSLREWGLAELQPNPTLTSTLGESDTAARNEHSPRPCHY